MSDTRYPELKAPHPKQQQSMPGETDKMDPRPNHGEDSYKGSGRLEGRAAIITGADSGIGRAVAIAYAREGADVLISYLSEDKDAQDTAKLVEEAGRKAILMPGDIAEESHCKAIVKRAVDAFGRLDILVNNAAHQATIDDIADLTAEELDKTFRTNIYSQFFLSKAALEHMKEGASIINTTSIQAEDPSPGLLAYAATKGAIYNFTQGLAQMVAEKGIRVNGVAPGPIWTPLIPSTMPPEKVEKFGANTPMKRAGHPGELAAAYVYLASDDASYTTGAIIAVTGGRPM
ncbi:SDR family oxidoreductase [Tianweitania sp. BSSL-BM11]|uniref:SDR family oxidoreductase n=1 Tax=Tianweitania aestuarii TaxID=2814886 RepID=A0ABS5RZF8_9HYPH|nr:SDR family oxidoreductase [Tianweitania aestuarii]MBS9722436.1 SDR family oxidoreductase [Tianweitania aestuarii]